MFYIIISTLICWVVYVMSKAIKNTQLLYVSLIIAIALLLAITFTFSWC